jgi:hypothetical protein
MVVVAGMSGYVAAQRGRGPDAALQPDYAPVATIKDLMLAIVDPSADDVWNAVKTTAERGGVNDVAPATAEDWAGVQRGALPL